MDQVKKCGVCTGPLKSELELKNDKCWVCLRLRNSALAEVHMPIQIGEGT